MAKDVNPISFRLPLKQRRLLHDIADSLPEKDGEKCSLGDAARLLVVDALERPEAYTQRLQALENQLYELRTELRQMAEVQANSVAKLLVEAGKLPRPVAQQWVKQNLVDRYERDGG